MKILVTGCAGFIGSHTCERLLKDNYEVIGLDNLDDYYDVSLKHANLNLLKKYEQFTFIRDDIRTTNVINDCKPEIQKYNIIINIDILFYTFEIFT